MGIKFIINVLGHEQFTYDFNFFLKYISFLIHYFIKPFNKSPKYLTYETTVVYFNSNNWLLGDLSNIILSQN